MKKLSQWFVELKLKMLTKKAKKINDKRGFLLNQAEQYKILQHITVIEVYKLKNKLENMKEGE